EHGGFAYAGLELVVTHGAALRAQRIDLLAGDRRWHHGAEHLGDRRDSLRFARAGIAREDLLVDRGDLVVGERVGPVVDEAVMRDGGRARVRAGAGGHACASMQSRSCATARCRITRTLPAVVPSASAISSALLSR